MEKRTPGRSARAGAETRGASSSTSASATCPGIMQHVTIPADVLSEGTFEDGHGFDGSSIRGFQQIQESDMILIPDPETAYIDPFLQRKTLVIHCFVADPVTGESYSRDPRYVAKKAEEYLTSTGIADTAYFGPEPEFFIFDDVRFDYTPNYAFHLVDSVEGIWNTGRDEEPEPRLQAPHEAGLLPRAADGPLPGPALGDGGRRSTKSASRSSCTTTRWPPAVRARSARSSTRCSPMGDQLMTFKYVLKNVAAHAAGKTLTFMPKPIFQDNGSGMHTHQSLWKDGEPLFFDETGYAGSVRHRPLVHRRPAAPRAGDPRVRRADHELLQAAGARLRGAGQPRVLAAQPVGGVPHPARAEEPEGQARRVPLPRLVVATRTWRSRRC